METTNVYHRPPFAKYKWPDFHSLETRRIDNTQKLIDHSHYRVKQHASAGT